MWFEYHARASPKVLGSPPHHAGTRPAPRSHSPDSAATHTMIPSRSTLFIHACLTVLVGLFTAALPAPAAAALQDAIEFYHAGLDHYFVTANSDEINKLDT